MGEMIYLDLTYRCNQRCLFCVSDHTNHKQFLDYQIDQTVLREVFYSTGKTYNILHISGGEPTLHPNLPELCAYAKNQVQTVLLSTNGIRFADRAYAKSILKTGIDSVIVPFFTVDASVHDEIVGHKGSFFKLIKGLQNLTELAAIFDTTFILKILTLRPVLKSLYLLPPFWTQNNIVPSEVQISGLHLSGKILNSPHLIPPADALSESVSKLIKALLSDNIPFSVYDIPWCILDDTALELLLSYGVLRPDNDAKDYMKIYWRGKRLGQRESHRFDVCKMCDIPDFCNGLYPKNVHLIEQSYNVMVRPLKF